MASEIIDIKTFSNSGLNSDSDLLAIRGGDSRYRLNVILSEDSNYEVLSNVQGNTLRSYSLPSGTNVIKGFVEDKENKAGIYFIWNSNNDHAIIRFNSEDNTFTEILVDQAAILPIYISSWKGFADTGIIGNEDEQFLVWADGRELHMINIKYAIDGNYNDPISEEEISFYKIPAIGSSNFITTLYSIGSPNLNLSQKIFQFAVRLKYYDNTFSTFSSWAEISFPVENMPNGRVSDDIGYDAIDCQVSIENEPTIVDAWQLLYRIVDIGGGAAGSWYIYEEYPYAAKGSFIKEFKNDKSIGIISDKESVRPYDYVPNKVNHIGIIDSNRVVTDVGEEGFDNVDINITPILTEVSVSGDGVVVTGSKVITSAPISANILFTENESDDHYIKVNVDNDNYTLSTFGLNGTNVGTEIKSYFDSLSISGLSIVDSSTATTVNLTFSTSTVSRVVLHTVLEKSITYRTLKTEASYKFGIEYGYNGKRGFVQTNDQCIFITPKFSALSSTETDYRIAASIRLNHSPPSDATDFRIVSFGSNIDYFEEYLISYNRSDLTDDSSLYTAYIEGPYTVIKKDDMINRMRKAYGDATSSIDYGFDIQKGDKIRFIGYFEYIPSLSYADNYDVIIVKKELEYVIDVVTSTEIKISSSALRTIETNTPADFVGHPWLIQIVRYKLNFDATPQEFSPSIPISSHGFDFPITDYFTDTWKSKQVYINENNASDYGVLFGVGYYAWMEKPKISLYYDSRPLSQGRVNIVNEFSEQRSDRRIRWGGKFIDEAGVNFLTKFDFDDSRDLDDRNGVINKIQQIGNVLKVYQERKITSFYLKTTSSIDANGNDTFVFDDAVMSVGRQSIEDYGCTHFTSYIKNVRNAYFFDIVNGAVVRDSANGFQEISNNLMHSYFKQKSRDIIEHAGTVSVFGGWDEDLELYLLTFVNLANLSDSINETIGFHEPTNRWVSFFSFLPEYYGKISGDQLLSFRGGALYEHNINATRNNFYGSQGESEVWVHSTEQGILNKIFNSIEINSINQWDCPDDDSIEIERPIVMQSRLVAGKFKNQEGIYRANFLRDSLNGGVSPTRNNLINGRQLRGKEMTLKLKNADTDSSLLESVIIKTSISK